MTGIRFLMRNWLLQMPIWAASFLVAASAAADWGWVERDLPPDIGDTIGSFGGAATHNGVEVFWNGQADSLIASTWTHDADGWSAGCGNPGGPGPCPQGVRVGAGLGDGPDGVLLFGGQSGELGGPAPIFGDMWRWSAAGWSQVCDSASCGPGARIGTAMAGNGTVAVLYGGFDGAAPVPDTWVYDGVDWTQVCGGSDPCGPGPIAGGTLGWDGSQFVLFGGLRLDASEPVPVDATWTFDVGSGEWTEVCGGADPCGPSPRAFALLAASEGGETALLGGFDLDGGIGFNDAWLWGGGAWNSIAVPWDTAPILLDDPEGCAVLPLHLTSRDEGVIALLGVFGSPRFGEEGGLVAVFGGEEPDGAAAGNPCVATSAAAPRAVPAIGAGLLALLGGLLGLIGATVLRRQAQNK